MVRIAGEQLMSMKNIGAKREKKRIKRLRRKEIKRKKLTAAEEKFNDLPRLEASREFASLLWKTTEKDTLENAENNN